VALQTGAFTVLHSTFHKTKQKQIRKQNPAVTAFPKLRDSFVYSAGLSPKGELLRIKVS